MKNDSSMILAGLFYSHEHAHSMYHLIKEE